MARQAFAQRTAQPQQKAGGEMDDDMMKEKAVEDNRATFFQTDKPMDEYKRRRAEREWNDAMTRIFAKQKRALTARDHGCAFPGCGKPAAWTEGHHIWHWTDGGPTDMNNLVLLCGFHHRLIHHSGWEVFIGTDQHPWFVPPASVDPYREPRQSHARAGPHIA